MEIAMVIGMCLAFVLGAYIRKPFSIVKKAKAEAERDEPEETYKDKVQEQFEKMMKYTGNGGGDDYDE